MNAWRALQGTGAMLVIGGLLFGCGDKGNAVSADGVCGRTLTPTAQRALEEIAGRKKFEDGGDTPEKAAGNFISHYSADDQENPAKAEVGCLVIDPSGGWQFIEVNFNLSSKMAAMNNEKTAKYKKYGVGVEAISLPGRGYLYFSCKSSRIIGGEPSIIRAELWNHAPGAADKDGPGSAAMADANIAVLQSVSSAFAKALRCKDAAGLG